MATIYELAAVPQHSRDGVWQVDFFKELPVANVKILNDAPVSGPDGWPYLLVELGADATEPLSKVLQWLATRGIGLVVNPNKDLPDAVLTYGMVWNFCQTGNIFSADGVHTTEIAKSAAPTESPYEIREGQKAHAGAPSEGFLPGYVRTVLQSFFHDNGVEKPKVLVMSMDQERYDLCFSIESLGSPDKSEHSGILEALSWFLPAHYSLVLASEIGLPAFVAL